MTTLLDAVDALTLPEVNHLAQKDDLGHWLKAVTVTHAPLLVRMREATFPSSNKTTGSASSASTRSLADLEAMHQYALMASQIGDWCRIAGVQPTRDPVHDLRAWYVTTLTNTVDTGWHTRKLHAWASVIRNHLDPPESFIAEHPCPVCHTTAYGNAVDGGDRYPIEVRYRKPDHGGMTDEHATCRVCRTTWVGHDAILELADELHENSATRRE